MRVLLIDDSIRAKIKTLIDYAEKNPFSMDELLDTHNKELAPAGDMDGFSLQIPMGYMVVYSIEKQPMGKVRHLSVSVGTENKMPSQESVQMIMEEFGFKNKLLNCSVSIEEVSPVKKAINILERI